MRINHFGAIAVHSLARGEQGRMVALKSSTVVTVPIKEAVAAIKRITLDGQIVQTARDIGISFGAPDEPDYVV